MTITRMQQALVDELIDGKFTAAKPPDGGDWYEQKEDGTDFGFLRSKGSFSEIRTFEGYDKREDLCVKIAKVCNGDSNTSLNAVVRALHDNELRALVRVHGAGVPGVVALFARTVWKDSPALVVSYHGDRTISKALRDPNLALDKAQKDDIIGQLVQTAVKLNNAGVAHNNVSARNVMVQLEKHANGDVSARATLIDFGASTILSDDGTSAPPTGGTPKYMDPQVTFARWAVENGVKIPCEGRVKGFQTDMYGIFAVAMKMHEDLRYHPLEGGGLSLPFPQDHKELCTLLQAVGSYRSSSRLDTDQVMESSFMKRWLVSSRYSSARKAAAAAVPEPLGAPHPFQSEVPQQEHGALGGSSVSAVGGDVGGGAPGMAQTGSAAQAAPDGGGGTSSAGGADGAGEKGSGFARSTAGAQAARNALPAAAAAAVAAASAEGVGGRAGASRRGVPGGFERDPAQGAPKRRHIGRGFGMGPSIAGAPPAAGAVFAGAPCDMRAPPESGEQQQQQQQQREASIGGGGSSSSGFEDNVGEGRIGAVLTGAAAAAATVSSWLSFRATVAAVAAAASSPCRSGVRAAAQAVASVARAGSGAAAAAPEASAGTEAAPARDGAISAATEPTAAAAAAAAGSTAGTQGSAKRGRGGWQGDGDQGSLRSRRKHGGGGGSGVGAGGIGAAGESAASVPASTERAKRLSTKRKTAESMRSKRTREAMDEGPKTRSKTGTTPKQGMGEAVEAAAGGGGPSSKRARHKAGMGSETRNVGSAMRKRAAVAAAGPAVAAAGPAGQDASAKRSRHKAGTSSETRNVAYATRKRVREAAAAAAVGAAGSTEGGASSKRSRKR